MLSNTPMSDELKWLLKEGGGRSLVPRLSPRTTTM